MVLVMLLLARLKLKSVANAAWIQARAGSDFAAFVPHLREVVALTRAYADAIRDNAQDDRQPIPQELVTSFQADCDRIISALSEAAAQ